MTAFSAGVLTLNKLAEQYPGNIDFYAIYILDAYPADVWHMQSNVHDGVLFRSAKDEAECALVAGACLRKLGIKFPALTSLASNRTPFGTEQMVRGRSRLIRTASDLLID